eukprot:4447434-Alexandrium_andersonii.AAC.1
MRLFAKKFKYCAAEPKYAVHPECPPWGGFVGHELRQYEYLQQMEGNFVNPRAAVRANLAATPRRYPPPLLHGGRRQADSHVGFVAPQVPGDHVGR